MGFKVCNHCGKKKPIEDFNWRWKLTGTRQPTCRECQHEQRKIWYKNNREEQIAKGYERKKQYREAAQQYVLDYLASHPCSVCGESDPRVLEFHHIKGKKKTEVARLINHGYSIKTIQKEISLCQVLCSNCHKKITYKDSWRD